MSAPLYIEFLPNFDMDDVEGMIKRYYREKNVLLVNFDYLQTSIKLMMQMATLSKGVRLREDQVLFMFSDCLKTCATKMKVHVDSGTQLNGEYKDAKEKDQSILRGQRYGPVTPYPSYQRGVIFWMMLTGKPGIEKVKVIPCHI